MLVLGGGSQVCRDAGVKPGCVWGLWGGFHGKGCGAAQVSCACLCPQIENASEVLITPLEKFRKEQIGAAKVTQALPLGAARTWHTAGWARAWEEAGCCCGMAWGQSSSWQMPQFTHNQVTCQGQKAACQLK